MRRLVPEGGSNAFVVQTTQAMTFQLRVTRLNDGTFASWIVRNTALAPSSGPFLLDDQRNVPRSAVELVTLLRDSELYTVPELKCKFEALWDTLDDTAFVQARLDELHQQKDPNVRDALQPVIAHRKTDPGRRLLEESIRIIIRCKRG